MKDSQDAYGHAMYDYLHGTGGFEIVERDDGYIDVSGGPPVYFSEYRNWPGHYTEAMKFVTGRVLDIGCGAGRIGLYLQKKGFDVTGIDSSPLAIKTSRERGLRKARLMSITRIGSDLGKFETLLMLGNNFSLLGNFKKARWLLKRFYHMTTQDARIIAESNQYTDTNEKFHLEYHKFNRTRGRRPGEARLRIRYKSYATPWFDFLMATREDLTEIVSGTGWVIDRLINSGTAAYIAIIVKKDP